MSLPKPALFDLLAGRELTLNADAITSAEEHRLGGLLLDAVESGSAKADEDHLRLLVAADIGVQTHHGRLWRAISTITDGLAKIGVDSALLKGVANEARWYERVGHRPSTDIDLLIAPHDIARIDEVLDLLAPQYSAPEAATELVRRRLLQHVHFDREDITIDVHLDPLKLGVEARTAGRIWESTILINRPDGGQLRALNAAAALVASLTHLNKDGFAYLGSFEEVRRIAHDPELDWREARRLVDTEGLAVPVWSSLRLVLETFDDPLFVPRTSGFRTSAFARLWPVASHLQGHEGRASRPHAQKLIPLLMKSRIGDAAGELQRFVLPSRALLDVHRPELRDHGLVRRLTIDRLPTTQ